MMRIIDRNHPADIKAYSSQSAGLRAKEKTSSGSVPASDSCQDRVLLSPLAKEIQAAKNQLQEIPDVRIDVVTEIRNQIDQGTYPVFSEKIAHRLMVASLLNELL